MSANESDLLPVKPETDLALDTGFGRSAGKILLTLSGVVVLIALWQGAVLWLDVPPYILPPPWRVLMALWAGLSNTWRCYVSVDGWSCYGPAMRNTFPSITRVTRLPLASPARLNPSSAWGAKDKT